MYINFTGDICVSLRCPAHAASATSFDEIDQNIYIQEASRVNSHAR